MQQGISPVEQAVRRFGARGVHDRMTPAQRQALPYVWKLWSRPLQRQANGEYTGQMEPPGDWLTWLILAGRGWGKTRVGAEFVRDRAKRHPGCRIAMIGATAKEAREVMGEGPSGLLSVCPPWERPHFNVTDQAYEWSNGSQAFLFSADKPDLFRGPQFHFDWVDEIAKWRRLGEAWYNIRMGLRLKLRGGAKPQLVATTTPRPLTLLRDLKRRKTTAVTVGTTYENAANLSEAFFEEVSQWEGSTIGRQELGGELFDEMPGAVFKRKWYRYVSDADLSKIRFDRIAIGVDPAETSGEDADDTGIVAAGVVGTGPKSVGYVLEDATCHETPDSAARRAVAVYHKHHAGVMVIDAGRNGELFASLVKMADPTIRVLVKGGNKGKRAWAEPVSGLYEQGRVFHVSSLDSFKRPILEHLEGQQTTWTDDGKWSYESASGEGTTKSPDRMDAASYVLTELMLHRVLDQSGLGTKVGIARRM